MRKKDNYPMPLPDARMNTPNTFDKFFRIQYMYSKFFNFCTYKKGLPILAIVFLLLAGSVFKLVWIIYTIVRDAGLSLYLSDDILEKMRGEDFSSLYYLAVVFAMIWLYSVLDAFWMGRKIAGE